MNETILTTTRFTLAVIARHAPLLDTAQVAALHCTNLAALDQWVNTLDEGHLADFAVFLHDRQRDMEILLSLAEQGAAGTAREFLEGQLCVGCRTLPLGARLAIPGTGGYRAASVQDAVDKVQGAHRGAS